MNKTSIDQFHWEGLHGFVDASTIAFRPSQRRLLVHGLIKDIEFEVTEVRRDADNDVLFWRLAPVNNTQPDYCEITVFND